MKSVSGPCKRCVLCGCHGVTDAFNQLLVQSMPIYFRWISLQSKNVVKPKWGVLQLAAILQPECGNINNETSVSKTF